MNSDVDLQFDTQLADAVSKHGYKRRKKYTHDEKGIPIEPFNIRDEIRSGMLTQQGYVKNNIVRDANEDEVNDPWLETIKAD